MSSVKKNGRVRALFVAILLCGICLGLGGNSPVLAQSPSLAEGSTKDVRGHLLGWKETFSRIKKLKGKVVVVDIWSTSCLPCMREFPNLVKLQNDHPKDVRCVSINIDYTGLDDDFEPISKPSVKTQQRVMSFLTKKKSKLINIICTDTDEDVYKQVDFASIPAVYVFDKNGKLRKLFYNDDMEYGKEGFEYKKHILPLVEKLRAEKVQP